jgi:hypothetical protein
VAANDKFPEIVFFRKSVFSVKTFFGAFSYGAMPSSEIIDCPQIHKK